MAPKRRIATLGGVFLLGLLLIDQSIRVLGDHLIQTNRWIDPSMRPTAYGVDWDLLFLGNCRALVLDPGRFQETFRSKVAVGGHIAESIGSLAFNFISALESAHGKRAVLVIDDWMLQTTQKESAAEIERRVLWWHLLKWDNLLFLKQKFGVSWIQWVGRWSGLWKYQGRGGALIRSALGVKPRREPTQSDPDPTTLRPPSPRLNVARYRPQRTTQVNVSPFALGVLSDLVRFARTKNVEVALVLPPMHWVRNEDAVNDAIVQAAGQLSQELDVVLLNYLGNQSVWALRDDWWVDPSHLNQEGAKHFSAVLAKDLERAWN